MKRTKGEWTFLYVMASLIALCSVLPFIWVLMTSVKSPEQIYDMNQIIPKYVTFDNFKRVLFQSNFVRYFLNSAYISVVVTVISMILAVMAAYGFCRYNIVGAGENEAEYPVHENVSGRVAFHSLLCYHEKYGTG